MSILEQVQTGRRIGAPRGIIYGDPKSGKTTLLASVPGIVMIPMEDGKGTLDYAELPQPEDYATLLATLRELATAKHDWKAVGIDGLTGVEELIQRHVLDQDFGGNMDKFMAYHKGYGYAAKVWIELCRELDAVRRRGMSVWCTAHSQSETVDDVSIGSYTRVTPALHKLALGVATKWSDLIGYIELERISRDLGAQDAKRQTRTSRTTGTRHLILEDTGSHMAGNRYGLESPIDLPEENPFGPVRAALRAAVAPKQDDNKAADTAAEEA